VKKHISFSELKAWSTCPYFRKLTYEDKLNPFSDSIHTTFGTAMHSVCENLVCGKDLNYDEHLEENFLKEILENKVEVSEEDVALFLSQGVEIIPEIIPAIKEKFPDYEIVKAEEKLYEPIEGFDDFSFKGFVDLALKTPDGKYHIIDWKTCSWGWDARRKSEKLTTYQLTLYKNFFIKKHKLDAGMVETYFGLLKRTAKAGKKVEIFRVTSGAKKTQNATLLLEKAIKNIQAGTHIKNRLSCIGKFGPCVFYRTERCKQ